MKEVLDKTEIDPHIGRDDSGEVLDSVIKSLDHLEERELSYTRLLILLLGRNRSIGDLVTIIYGMKSDQPGYRKLYMRVSRRLKSLQSKGFVSKALFGKEKPYRITRLGRRTISMTLTLKTLTDTGIQKERAWSKTQTIVILAIALNLLVVLVSPPTLLRQILLYILFLLVGAGGAMAVSSLKEVM